MNDDTVDYWVGFNLVKGIGAVRMRLLLNAFGDARLAWEASAEELVAAGLSERLAESVVQTRLSGRLDQARSVLDALSIDVVTWDDPRYPRRLAEADGPPVLYVRGTLTGDDLWSVAIVGTRRATAYGRQTAEELAGGLAGRGVTIVSGLARGIDAVAHQAALRAGGRTLAVLGSSVDEIYPPEHKRLAEEIADCGAVISDYPPGTAPEAANFPPRNRIISGLSQAVIVIEAGEKSGSLITANFALQQGRPLFAVPGNIYAVQNKGSNRLLKSGARPLLGLQDALDELKLERIDQQRQARRSLPANAAEAQLYALLGAEPRHVDDLRNQAGLPIEQISATLTLMELKGLVRQVGGMNYVAVKEENAEYNV